MTGCSVGYSVENLNSTKVCFLERGFSWVKACEGMRRTYKGLDEESCPYQKPRMSSYPGNRSNSTGSTRTGVFVGTPQAVLVGLAGIAYESASGHPRGGKINRNGETITFGGTPPFLRLSFDASILLTSTYHIS